MTKEEKYRTEDGTNFHTQKAKENIYINTQVENTPDEKEDNNTYEALDFSQTQNTAESPKQLSDEPPRAISTDSKAQIPVSSVRSIRCLQATCAALFVAVIIMAATIGSIMSEQKAQIDSTEGKSDLLKSEMDHKGYDVKHLQFQITQVASDIKNLATVFQQMNDTIKSDKAENYATNQNQSMSITQLKAEHKSFFETLQNNSIRIMDNYATNQNQSTSITQLKAEQNSVLETLQNYNIRNTDIEEKPMVGFTARNNKDYLNGALTYTKVLSQVGAGFNRTTGVFTCPVAGLYLVSMTLQVQTDGQINCWLHKNQRSIDLEIHIDGKGEESASQTAVLKLRQGDSLYIGSCEETNIGDETTFTVVLIQADT